MRKFSLVTLLFMIISFCSFSGEGSWSKRFLFGDVFLGNEESIEMPVWAGRDAQVFEHRFGMIHLEYTRKNHSDLQDRQWRIFVTVEHRDASTQLFEQEVLSISYDKTGEMQYSDYVKFDIGSLSKYYAKITGITGQYYDQSSMTWITSSNPQADPNFPTDIDYRLELRSEEWYNLDILSDNGNGSEGELVRMHFDPLTFRANWSYLQGAEQYDFEWVWIDALSKEAHDLQGSSPSGIESWEWPFILKEPSRVRVSQTHHILDNTYAKGELYFRVRALSKFIDNGIEVIDQVKEGDWTYFSIPQNYGNQLNVQSHTIDQGSSFEEEKNWLYGIAYAEEGKSVSTVTFYDGSNRGRQSLTYNTSDDITLIGETKFDREGRQTVSVIPAPVKGRQLGYRENFNLALDGSLFDEDNYDFTNYQTTTTSSQTQQMASEFPVGSNNVLGAAQYFSPNNSFDDDLFHSAIPDANGYVYSQTIYRNDGTGRVERVGGIGEEFTVDGDHAVRTFYGSPSSFELHRLFGSNVADTPNGYRKEMVRDANGQFSVTYYDKRGNVIATGLSGNAPDNLIALDDQNPVKAVTDLSANNIAIDPYTLVAEHTYLNTEENSDMTLNYSLNGFFDALNSQTVTVEGQTVSFPEFCSSCSYKLRIEVKDQYGNYIAPSESGVSIDLNVYEEVIQSNELCTDPSYSVPTLTSPSLLYDLDEIGEYRIIKTLTVDVEDMQNEFDTQLANLGLDDPQTFISNYVANMDYSVFEGCFFNCEEYCDAYQKDQFFKDNPGFPESAWDPANNIAQQQLIDQCVGEECNTDEQYENFDSETLGDFPTINPVNVLCDGKKDQMIDQISPGGAFYDTEVSGFWAAVLTGEFGGVETNTTVISGVNNDVAVSFLYLQDPSNFPNGLPQEVIDFLLPYHKEYCHLVDNNGIMHCELWAETMNYSNGLIEMLNDGSQLVGSSTLFTTPFSQIVNSYSEDPFLTSVYNSFTGTNFSGNNILEDVVLNYADYSAVFDVASPCPAVSLGIPSELAYTNVTFGSSGHKSLRDYIANFVNCVIQEDPNYPSLTQANIDYYDQLARMMFKSLFDNVKQTIINDYKQSVSGCSYYSDQNAVFQGPLSQQDLEDQIASGLGVVFGSIDCEELAYNNADHWIEQIPDACLQELENNSAFNPNFTQLELADQITLQGNLEQLFYDYTIATCPENTWGWFFNPDPNDPSLTIPGQNADVDGEAEYIAIHTLFANTNECDQTMLFSIEPPVVPGNITINGSIDILTDCFETLFASFNDGILALQAQGGSSHTGLVTIGLPTLPASCGFGGSLTIQNSSANNGFQFTFTTDQDPACSTGIIIPRFLNTNTGFTIDQVVSFENPVVIGINVVFDVVLTSGEIVQGFIREGLFGCLGVSDNTITSITDPSVVFPTVDYTNDCIEAQIEQAQIDALDIYNQMLTELQNEFLGSLSSCIESATETFTMEYDLKEYQYTLYYYDLAGNLVQTVPPQGVDIVDASHFPLGVWDNTDPVHKMETRYKYNGLNTLIAQYTPDGGHTDFVLDKLYRVRYSRNARQADENKASYTQYDELGRVSEAGEMYISSGVPNVLNYLGNKVEDNNFPGSLFKMDHTKTYYEEGYPNDVNNGILNTFSDGQKNLRNTIGAIEHIQADYPINGGTPLLGSEVRTVISYSYDAHKNVEECVTTNYDLAVIDQAHKIVRYEYDLISGNVNELHFQAGEVDQYTHKYQYDANNRLVRAFTSKDAGDSWDMDAKYFYYLHGALARTELGEDKVQGNDFAYNLQGWLKGVNSATLEASRDIGKDAGLGDNQWTGIDVYGYQLSYYDGDYQPIVNNVATNAFVDVSDVKNKNIHPTKNTTAPSNLYNGNISNMTTALRDLEESPIDVLSNNYQYDQLQRIRSMKVYYAENLVTNNNFSGAGLYNGGAYATSYEFDKNGNLKRLTRNGYRGDEKMDDFTYSYNSHTNSGINTSEPVETNQLANVLDAITNDPYTTDIESGQINGVDNYIYDASGQLKEDEQEGIDEIIWSVTGKVKEIKFTPESGKNDLKFVYDPMDMRVMKIEYENDSRTRIKYTYYTFDAQGNVLATYDRRVDTPRTPESGVIYEDMYSLKEHMIYGSSRLGIDNRNQLISIHNITQPLGGGGDIELGENFEYELEEEITPVVFERLTTKRVVGNKYYELSNHLGNVLEVITDQKLGYNHNGAIVYTANVISFSDYYPYGMLLPSMEPEDCQETIEVVEEVEIATYENNLDTELQTEEWEILGVYPTAEITHDPAVGRLKLTTEELNANASKIFNLVPGTTYRIRFDAEHYTTNGGLILYDGSLHTQALSQGINYYEFTAGAGASNTSIGFKECGTPNGTSVIYIDNFELVEIGSQLASYSCHLAIRSGSEADYRYGFQGQETDDEVKGKGNSYGYEARMYDPRIGKWLSMDAVAAKKPYLSPYQGMKNNPLTFIDPDGNDEWNVLRVVDQDGNVLSRHAYKTSTAIVSEQYTYTDPMFGTFNKSRAFDFKNVVTVIVKVDASKNYEIVGGNIERMMKRENGEKDRRHFDVIPTGTVYRKEYHQPGGIYMTGSSGQGTMHTASSTEYGGNIDNLMTVFGAIQSGFPKKFNEKKALEDLNGTLFDQVIKMLGKEDFTQKKTTFDDKGNSVNDLIDSELEKLDGEAPIVFYGPEEFSNGGEGSFTIEGKRSDTSRYLQGGSFNTTRDTFFFDPFIRDYPCQSCPKAN